VTLPVIGTKEDFVVAPSKIVAVGFNYREHVVEGPGILPSMKQVEAPALPILFPKTPNVLIAPDEAIVIPTSFLKAAGLAAPRTDYEAELAVIIGRRCRNVSPEEALGFVYGYSCFNDVSQRDIQNGDRSGWWRGKSFDSFGPLGPAILPASALPDPSKLVVEGRLNGRTVQRSSLSLLIFSVAELISYISKNLTLEPGDIIATGTPSGVGPLKAGDVFEVAIECIGVLRNPVREE
jgi:2-keto-4-pentenoate hydratase/2-oxohepta-3-ene-1,7-dioic acid hydratase in catechol pathway